MLMTIVLNQSLLHSQVKGEKIISSNGKLTYKRTKGKVNADYKAAQIYKFFVNKYGNLVDNTTYQKICREFNQYIFDYILSNPTDFYLSSHMGCIGIRKSLSKPYVLNGEIKIRHLHIDYKATKQMWLDNPELEEKGQVVRISNRHTDGYQYQFYWDKSTCSIPNKSVYRFVANRTSKRRLASLINSEDRIDYPIKQKFYAKRKVCNV